MAYKKIVPGRYFNMLEKLYIKFGLKNFSSSDIKDAAKLFGIPPETTGMFITYAKCLIRVDRGVYRFIAEPAHKDGISILTAVKSYSPPSRVKRTCNKGVTHHPSKGIELTEDEAIALLKQKGYKVMRPITQFEEV